MTSTEKHANSNKWINGIDSLRFFLALIVFLSHIPNPYPEILKGTGSPILHFIGLAITPAFSGTSAVIAFFIISGFVIHYPNKNTVLDVKKFLIRRWVRIGLPLIIIGWVAIRYDSFFLIPVWSLYCELVYYTLYPILRKIKMRWKTQFILTFLLAYAVIAIFASGTVLSFIEQKDINFLGQYWSLGTGLTWIIGLPCWLLGVLLANQFDAIRSAPSTSKLWLFRTVVFILSIGVTVIRFKFYASWLVTENIFAIVLFFWLRNELAYYKFNRSIGFFERLGKFSYSLYLCHPLLFLVLSMYLPLNGFTYPIVIVAVVAMSYLVYLVVEYPSHRLAQKLTKKKIRTMQLSPDAPVK